jgi:8-oxo-dGTP pyrophosphatase MutT (NUDIX family)
MYLKKISQIISSEPIIIGREKYLNSAVLIPIVLLNDVEYFLFQKRSQSVRQPGEVSFPGGHFDIAKDLDFQSTAVRETSEELGIDESKIIVLGKLGTLVAPMGVIVETFIGKLNINSLDELCIDKKEVDKIFLVPIDFFIKNNPSEYIARLELHPSITNENGDREELFPVKDLGLPERYALPWTRGKHRILVYNNTEDVIWGITAELVYELSNKLKVKTDK